MENYESRDGALTDKNEPHVENIFQREHSISYEAHMSK